MPEGRGFSEHLLIMSRVTDHGPLIERLREAKEPSRELDWLIWQAAYADQGVADDAALFDTADLGYAFTRSLDAIYELVSARLPTWSGIVDLGGGATTPSAGLWPSRRGAPGRLCTAIGRTPALALCLAFVQALALENERS